MFNQVYAGKKVLVTGHTGFKGSWLSLWLMKLGAEVAGFSAYIPSEPANFEVCQLGGRMKDYRGDVRDLEALEKVVAEFQPDLIFHLAAQAIVRTAYEDPKMTFDTNAGGTVNVLEVLRKTPAGQNVKAALFITSDKCYENVEWEYGYRETDALGGKDPYSASKAAAEIAISTYARSYFDDPDGCQIASVRAGNVIGGGDWAVSRIVPDCARAWAKGEVPEIRSPHATRPWQHVLEPLSGYLHLMACLASKGLGEEKENNLRGMAFNFGPPENVTESVAQLVTAMTDIWDGTSWLDCSDPNTIQKEAGLLKLNCDRARQRLGWVANLTLDESIRMTTEWYMSYYQNKIDQNKVDMYAYTLGQIEAYERLGAERERAWSESVICQKHPQALKH